MTAVRITISIVCMYVVFLSAYCLSWFMRTFPDTNIDTLLFFFSTLSGGMGASSLVAMFIEKVIIRAGIATISVVCLAFIITQRRLLYTIFPFKRKNPIIAPIVIEKISEEPIDSPIYAPMHNNTVHTQKNIHL